MTDIPAATHSSRSPVTSHKLRVLGLAMLAAVAVLTLSYFTAHGIRWRTQVVTAKALGRIDDISWIELVTWLRPGSPLYLEPLSIEPNPFAGLHNPYDSVNDKETGRQLFVQHCSACHGANAEGQTAPGLIDRIFKLGDSDWALFRTVTRGMPDVAMPPVDIPPKETWQILAFVKQLRELGRGAATDKDFERLDLPVSSDVPGHRIEQATTEPQNWLTYSGTYQAWRHSTLDEIDTANVAELRLAWALQLQTTDSVETSPLVVDGVLYLTEPPSNVLAVDAATGRVLWAHRRRVPNDVPACCGRVNRGVAVLGSRVYIATLDGILVALDARTGTVDWEVAIADYRQGYSSTGAPLAVRDMVVVGIGGGDYGTNGFIDAYNAVSGERRWRFETIPRPGEPGADTWGGDSAATGGGATWMTGSYDASLDLVYWGVGNPAPDFNGDTRPGDNLFTNSVVALRSGTGELAWYFQFTPHDEHDWDANQIPVLVDRELDGEQRRLMLWANRNGFYYVLDRTNGEFLTARALVTQNWAESIDANGRPILTPNAAPSPRGTLTWPGVYGGANWWSPSYSPMTGLFYVVPVESPRVFFKESGSGSSQYHQGNLLLGSAVSDPGEPMRTAVRALDPLTGEVRWERPLSLRRNISEIGGVLTTAGNLLFVGDRDEFVALDARDGTDLWRVRLGRINANPITFGANGRQFVAVAAGNAIFAFQL